MLQGKAFVCVDAGVSEFFENFRQGFVNHI